MLQTLSDQLLKDIDYNSTKVEKMEANVRNKNRPRKNALARSQHCAFTVSIV